MAAALPVPANVFYSDEHHFRIVYPVGVVRNRDAASAKNHERESFQITSPDGQVLHGLVTADEDNKASTNDLVNIAIAGIKNANVTLRVVKKDWYAISGTQGDNIFYQKGFTGFVHSSVSFDYPAKAKKYFDPLVASMSNSFEPYIYFRGTVSLVNRLEAGGGSLWLEQGPEGANNVRTVCYYSEKDIPTFGKLKDGQLATVAGKHEFIVLRENSDQQSGLYETVIKACVLLESK